MRISVLLENTSSRPELTAEHGLSLFIETNGHKILFDTGQSSAFALNAEKMGIDLSQADIAVLSHGHYDHGGGIKIFFEINKTAPIYANENVFLPYCNGTEKYIGLDASLKDSKRIILCGAEKRIDCSLKLFSRGSMTLTEPVNSFGLNKKCGGKLIPDDFMHEQYLLIEENGKTFLISGCSHAGIINIENSFEPDFFIGGFHLSGLCADKPEENAQLKRTGRMLDAKNTKYYTGHCTGALQFAILKDILGEKAEYISAGKVFNF